ncbi:hypothetical protein D3C71_502810 [compost metagenome]
MKISLSILFLLFLASANTQEMINGGFETAVNSVSPYPGYDYAVEYAPPWKSIYGTADVCHPNAPSNIGGFTYQGQGMARLGHLNEYMQGKTLNLVAGTTYEISFWAQIRFPSPVYIRNLGMMIGTTDFSSGFDSVTDFDPQLLVSVGTNWTTGSYCFTAQTSGIHYVVIGGKCDPIPDDDANYFLWNIDDVSVTEISNNSGVPVADITTTQTQFCIDNIVLDGSTSSNETGYHWVIEQKLPDGKYLCLYNQTDQNGQAGVFNVNNAFASIGHTPGYGGCYRAYLYTSNQCEVRDRLDFCIVNPNVFFITDGSPVCENLPVDLQVTGDNGWTYTWSNANGQLASGTGLKNLSVTPTIGNSTYTVVVTTPQGCTSTETITLTVNSQNNLAPWMDGINGTGEYTYYVSQGDAVFFNSVLSNDHLNEVMNIVPQTNVPSGFSVILPTISGSVFSFSWVTSSLIPTGEYYYTLTVDDQNACDPKTSVFKFRIIVVCDQCPVCVSYEDRTPSGTPLPAETKAGKCIEAGLAQTVSTGDADVLFQAGVYITEGPYFDAGPGYQGVIDPTTCVTDCEDCCNDWTGFTYDEIPNPVYMNFTDGNPTNDIFQLTDIYHPFCAFGAKGFHFEILRTNASNNPLNSNTDYQFTVCCPFESPALENPIPHSPIWWDGYYTNMWGNQSRAENGTYIYQIELYGCNGEVEIMQGYIHILGGNGMIQNPNGQETTQSLNNSLTSEQQEELKAFEAESERLDKVLSLFPNPTTDIVQITGVDSEDVYYQVFDDKGVLLSRKEKVVNQSFSLTKYSKGTYYIRIYSGATYVVRKVIKM